MLCEVVRLVPDIDLDLACLLVPWPQVKEGLAVMWCDGGSSECSESAPASAAAVAMPLFSCCGRRPDKRCTMTKGRRRKRRRRCGD